MKNIRKNSINKKPRKSMDRHKRSNIQGGKRNMQNKEDNYNKETNKLVHNCI